MDLQEQIDLLKKEQSRFTRNRNLCLIGLMVLIFTGDVDIKTAPIYYIVAMSAIILGLLAIAFYDHRFVRKYEKEIVALDDELEKMKAENQVLEENLD